MSDFDFSFNNEDPEKKNLDQNVIYDIVIIGAGPGGLTAAIYAGRSRLNTIVLEKVSAGGQIAVSDWVENYPGFPDGISGRELVERFKKQAEKFGAKIIINEVLSIRKEKNLFYLNTESVEIKTKSVILSTGSEPVKLPVPEEEKFRGKGISYCATCDAAFFKDKIVCVIGGGDTALHETVYLSKLARKVILMHRRNKFRAAKMLQEELFANPKVEFKLGYVPIRILGNKRVEGIEIENVETHQRENLSVDGIFGAIGEKPNSELVNNLVELTERGFVKTDEDKETSLKGLFAVGDVTDTPLRQVVTACSDGAIAVTSAEKYMRDLER